MAAYMIARFDVTDMEKFKHESAAAGALTVKFGGNYLTRGGALIGLENHAEDVSSVFLSPRSSQTALSQIDELPQARKR